LQAEDNEDKFFVFDAAQRHLAEGGGEDDVQASGDSYNLLREALRNKKPPA